MVNKRIPYGISDYEYIVDGDYIYVDKTQYIEKLENFHSPYIFFLRPRRFGKSLFTSVLANYYDINEKGNFEKFFENTYIGKNPTKDRNTYYILKFNFSGLNTETKESLETSFLNGTKTSYDNFLNQYNISIDYLRDGSPADVFDSFLSKVRIKIKGPLYVIIDEYDHFANELLSFQTELFEETVSRTGFVRKWYEVLKKGTENMVKKIFATGVSPIALDSFTSGFNIASDLTRHPAFNEMMGFTKEEVKDLIKNTSKIPISSDEIDRLMVLLQNNYNGYLFSEDARVKLFNSDMILYYVQYYVELGRGPENLIDKNIASDYGKLGKLFELKNKNKNMKILESILKEEDIITRITEQFSMEKYFTEDDFKSLLFYLGMLTIDSKFLGRVKLKVPNYAVKGLYFEFFIKCISEFMDFSLNLSDIEDSMAEVALNGINERLISVVEMTLNKLSNRDYINFDEKYVKVIFLTYCFMSRIYLVKSEYEVEDGYIDIALLPQPAVTPDYYAIFELKYISKSEYEKFGDAIVEKKKEEALNQLKTYLQSEELRKIPQLKKWALVFVNDKCVVNMEL